MSVNIRIIGEPVHVEQVTRDLRAVYRVIEERDAISRRNHEHIRRYLIIATSESNDKFEWYGEDEDDSNE